MAKELSLEVQAQLNEVNDLVIREAARARLQAKLNKSGENNRPDNSPEKGTLRELQIRQSRRARHTTGASVVVPKAVNNRPLINLDALAAKARKIPNREIAEEGVLEAEQQADSNLKNMRKNFGTPLDDPDDKEKSADPYTEVEYDEPAVETDGNDGDDRDDPDLQSLASASSESLKANPLPDLRLHDAIRSSRFPALFALVYKHGVPVNGVDEKGKTALHVAADLRFPGVVTYLINVLGADPSIRNGEGKTARDIALDKGFDDVVAQIDKMQARRESDGNGKDKRNELMMAYNDVPPPGGVVEVRRSEVPPERSGGRFLADRSVYQPFKPGNLNPNTELEQSRGRRGIFGCCEGCVVQ